MPSARELEGLYRTHGYIVLRRATRLLGNADDARDVLQQVFLSLVKDPTRLRNDASITAYLYRATTSVCLQWIRNGKTRAALMATRVAPAQGEAADASAETMAMVRELVTELSDEHAFVVIAQYVDGMTHDEIAAQIGCSRRHVGNLIESARQAILRRVA